MYENAMRDDNGGNYYKVRGAKTYSWFKLQIIEDPQKIPKIILENMGAIFGNLNEFFIQLIDEDIDLITDVLEEEFKIRVIRKEDGTLDQIFRREGL